MTLKYFNQKYENNASFLSKASSKFEFLQYRPYYRCDREGREESRRRGRQRHQAAKTLLTGN